MRNLCVMPGCIIYHAANRNLLFKEDEHNDLCVVQSITILSSLKMFYFKIIMLKLSTFP